ncbi:MAG: hypothetical protein WBP59_09470 [Ilumatobacteraceae bacterium]
MFRSLRTIANPFTRTALIAFTWSHRRTILRWGRSLWNELREPRRIDPARLVLIGKVLWAITREEQFAQARQLRHVRLDGDSLVVDATPGWRGTARLVDELAEIDGISAIVDAQGTPLSGTVTTTATG